VVEKNRRPPMSSSTRPFTTSGGEINMTGQPLCRKGGTWGLSRGGGTRRNNEKEEPRSAPSGNGGAFPLTETVEGARGETKGTTEKKSHTFGQRHVSQGG